MKRYEIESLPLKDAFLLHLPRYTDERGYFVETFRSAYESELGLPSFVQDNLSYSRRGVLRGLHFQKPPHPQAKLITALQGTIRDVLVDLRPSSPTYRRWHAVILSADSEKHSWLYAPIGFAHGFYVLSERALVLYKCSAYYDPTADAGIRWDDPTLAIAWGIQEKPILSAKDAALPYFDETQNPFSEI